MNKHINIKKPPLMDAGCPAVQCPCPICFVLTNACLLKHAMSSLAPASENPDRGQTAPSDWPHQNEELILGVIFSTVTLVSGMEVVAALSPLHLPLHPFSNTDQSLSSQTREGSKHETN